MATHNVASACFVQHSLVLSSTLFKASYREATRLETLLRTWAAMTDEAHDIRRLPPPVQARLRSSQILTSLPQIISELVQNALDANASAIDIGLDCAEWTVWVRDDGSGISKDGLESLAEEGGRYNTSKTYAPGSLMAQSPFGFRGEALASAADISCLEICSRTAISRNTWSVIMKAGKTLYMGPAVRWKREAAGTAVCVRDAFYNLPVRRQAHTAAPRTWDLVRKEIEVYALMFPHVAFSLEDTRSSGGTSQQRERIFRVPKTASTLETFRRLFGSALAELKHIEPVQTAENLVRIEGFISLVGATSKAYQFLYINGHPIVDADLGRVIESQFANSSFGKNALDEDGEGERSTIRRSPRKNEKKPVYVLNITIAPEDVDNCLDPTKSFVQLRNKSTVASVLLSTVQSFLTKHGFVNKQQSGSRTPHDIPSPSPRKRKKEDRDNTWFDESDSITELSTLSLNVNENNDMVEAPIANPFDESVGSSKQLLWVDPATRERFLVDQRTGNSYLQTGQEGRPKDSLDKRLERGRRTLRKAPSNSLASVEIDPPTTSSIPSWLEKALKSNRTYATTEKRIPSVQILPPDICQNDAKHDPFQTSGYKCNPPSNHTFPGRVKNQSSKYGLQTSMHRFTREELRHADIISQVDRKFIACRITKRRKEPVSATAQKQSVDTDIDGAETRSTLVLIDQHAADERVRVEHFLKQLCLGFLCAAAEEAGRGTPYQRGGNESRGVRTRGLNPPRPVLLTQHEAHTIEKSHDIQDMLQKCGVGFAELSTDTDIPDTTISESGNTSSAYSQLLVSSVPEVVGDKLLQGNELRDFIKGFLGQIESGELSSTSQPDLDAPADQDEFFWLKALRRCPKALVDLVNSKACRGAIMFNDLLTFDQCEKLVKRLSETAFPFQCAHGRPSLVPLVEISAMKSHVGTRRHRRPPNDWGRFETMGNA